VDTGKTFTYPPALVDCLPSGVNLPPLDAAGAVSTWSAAAPVFARSATRVTLSNSGKGILDFGTTPASPASGCPSSSAQAPPATGSASITVTRPGIKDLQQVVTNMVTNGFGVAGSIVSPAVQSLLSPIVEKVQNQLDNLTNVSGTGYVTVTYPADQTGSHCTTTTAATTSTTTAKTKALSCPTAGTVQSYLALPYAITGGGGFSPPGATYVPCIYYGASASITCPDGDGSFVNGAAGGCLLVEVVELTGASTEGLDTFCSSSQFCRSEGGIPPSDIDGATAIVAVGPERDPAAILVRAVKAGFEVDVEVGYDGSEGRIVDLVKVLIEQHFGDNA
jgi:hypothetical protein